MFSKNVNKGKKDVKQGVMQLLFAKQDHGCTSPCLCVRNLQQQPNSTMQPSSSLCCHQLVASLHTLAPVQSHDIAGFQQQLFANFTPSCWNTFQQVLNNNDNDAPISLESEVSKMNLWKQLIFINAKMMLSMKNTSQFGKNN
ncbi:hypothetical protein ACA910_009623 [Epithemia clementina (nom. ined.)]